MPFEKSAGAVIFRKEKNKIYYLLLRYPSGAKAPKEYWDFAKGHIEKGEKELETVKREVQEETGLGDLKFMKGFKEPIYYFFKHKEKTVFKVVNFYLAQTKKKKVRISFEHISFRWLPFKKALSQLTFDNAKEILNKANAFLRENE